MPLPINRDELRERLRSGEQFAFYLFYGHKPPYSGVDASCLSQWFERDFTIEAVTYPTAEHWMMAEKARLFEDPQMLDAILDAAGPREAKAFGRKVKGFDPSVWEQHRFEIVCLGNLAKFSQNHDLKDFLLGTSRGVQDLGMVAESKEPYVGGDADVRDTLPFQSPSSSDLSASNEDSKSNVILVEAAGRDTIWGIGLGQNNPKSQDPFQWRGLNLLGFALTVVREQLFNEPT